MGDRKAPNPPPTTDNKPPPPPAPPQRAAGRERVERSQALPHLAWRDPETAAEWQEAVDLAEFYLLLDSARAYGLATGGPEINPERCQEILKRGRGIGYRPKRS